VSTQSWVVLWTVISGHISYHTLTMSSSRTTIMPILKRSFHASTSRRSHIGSLPITLPQSVTLSLPPTSISPTLPTSSPLAQRLVTVTGPLGTQTLPILPPIILSTSGTGLTVTVHDSEEKSQRSLWGLTRSLINNAIKGVSEGYKVDLRLVGVGYRGAVEPIPKVFLDLQSQMPRIARPSKPGAPPYVLPPLPTERLNMKLGYAHPVLIDIPAGITVTTPAPTKIVLSGTDKQKLGLFAAKIRRWRKPEPYRGKVSHPLIHHHCITLTYAGYICRRRDNQAQGDQEEVVACIYFHLTLHELHPTFPLFPERLLTRLIRLALRITIQQSLP
jgi:large subunit ribosomal protein L6